MPDADEQPASSRVWMWVVGGIVLVLSLAVVRFLMTTEAAKPKAARLRADAGAALPDDAGSAPALDGSVEAAVLADPLPAPDAGGEAQAPDAAVVVVNPTPPVVDPAAPEKPKGEPDERAKLEWTVPARFPAGGSGFTPRNTKAMVLMVKNALALCSGHVVLEGHSSNQGFDAVRDRLALERAQNVRKRLISLGVPAGALKAISLSDRKPVASNDTDRGRAQNRRVTVRCDE